MAQDASERAAQGQRALDVRQAQVAERENDMKDLKHALQTQHSDLQHRHQQLQVRCYALLLLLKHCQRDTSSFAAGVLF